MPSAAIDTLIPEMLSSDLETDTWWGVGWFEEWRRTQDANLAAAMSLWCAAYLRYGWLLDAAFHNAVS